MKSGKHCGNHVVHRNIYFVDAEDWYIFSHGAEMLKEVVGVEGAVSSEKGVYFLEIPVGYVFVVQRSSRMSAPGEQTFPVEELVALALWIFVVE